MSRFLISSVKNPHPGHLIRNVISSTGNLPATGARLLPILVSSVRPINTTTAVRSLKDKVTLYFKKNGVEFASVKANVGDNLLDTIVDNEVDIDGYGACEGTLSCSTCHLIFDQDNFDNLLEEPTDEEMDMLDLAYGVTDTSRLGCQVYINKKMDGWTITVPEATKDARDV